MSQCPCDEITEWVPAFRSAGDALPRRRQGRRLAQHRPIVTQIALSEFGLSGVQTDSAVTSVVGAAAADVEHASKVQGNVAALRTEGAGCCTTIGAYVVRSVAVRRDARASRCNARLTDGCARLRAVAYPTRRRDARSERRTANPIVARPALANMPALPAVVRIRKGIRASSSGRPSRTGSAHSSRRAAAIARKGRSCGAATDARSVLHALVVHAGESAVAGARRQAGATLLSLSTRGSVVIVAAAAGARYRGQPNHQHPQSLVQSHRMIPFPYQRPEAFHASLREATLLEMAPL